MAAAHLSIDISSGSLAAILPFFVSNYGMDYTRIAGLMFASSFLSSIIQPLFGYMADKGSRQWFMGLGAAMTGLCFAVTGFVTEYWLLFAMVTCMGIGSAIFHPEAARMVNLISGRKKASGMSIFSVGGNAGFGFGPLLLVFLVTTFGMKGTALYGIIGVLMGIALLVMMPRIKAAAMEKLGDDTADTADEGKKQFKQTGENDWKGFGRLSLVILFRSTVFSAISGFLPLYCIQVLMASPAEASATLSIISISGVVATLIGGKLADKWGYVKTLRYGCIGMVPLLAVVAFGNSMYAVYAMLIPLSFCMQGTYSPFVVLGQSYLAKNIGFASGITMGLSFSLGNVALPAIGWFADTNGIHAVIIMIVVIAACCGVSTLLLKEPKNIG